jgi:hypothetical protein
MKLFDYSIKLLLIIATLVACTKKAEEASTDPAAPVVDSVITISSKTTTAFTGT